MRNTIRALFCVFAVILAAFASSAVLAQGGPNVQILLNGAPAAVGT